MTQPSIFVYFLRLDLFLKFFLFSLGLCVFSGDVSSLFGGAKHVAPSDVLIVLGEFCSGVGLVLWRVFRSPHGGAKHVAPCWGSDSLWRSGWTILEKAVLSWLSFWYTPNFSYSLSITLSSSYVLSVVIIIK